MKQDAATKLVCDIHRVHDKISISYHNDDHETGKADVTFQDIDLELRNRIVRFCGPQLIRVVENEGTLRCLDVHCCSYLVMAAQGHIVEWMRGKMSDKQLKTYHALHASV